MSDEPLRDPELWSLWEQTVVQDKRLSKMIFRLQSDFARSRISDSIQKDDDGNDLLPTLVMLAGSLAEGTAICRYLTFPVPYAEVDQMTVVMNFGESHRGLIIPVPERPGFYNLKSVRKHLISAIPKCQSLRKRFENYYDENLRDEMYLKASDVKEMIEMEEKDMQQEYGKEGHKNTLQTAVETYYLLRHKPSIKVSVDYVREKVGPSLMLLYTFKNKNDEAIYQWSLDRVSSVHLGFWPKEFSEFLNRQRKWPTPEQVQRVISKGCHLVPKEDVSWRISFSGAEIELNKLRTPPMHVIYLVFKTIFYQHIRCIEVKDIDGEQTHVGSYVAKTTMMWLQEEQESVYWEKTSIADILSVLYNRLGQHLSDGNLGSFFEPSLNILAEKPAQLLKKAASMADKIGKDPMNYAQKCITQDVLDKTTHNIKLLEELCDFIENPMESLNFRI